MICSQWGRKSIAIYRLTLPLQRCLSSWQLYSSILTFRLFIPAALSVALVLDIWSLFVNKKHIHVIRITPKANNHILIIETVLRPRSQFQKNSLKWVNFKKYFLSGLQFFFSGGRTYSLTPSGKINGFGSHWIGSVLKAKRSLVCSSHLKESEGLLLGRPE